MIGALLALSAGLGRAQEDPGFVEEKTVEAGTGTGYGVARIEAARLADAGRFAEAAARIEAALPEYLDDFTLQLDAAYYHLRAEAWERAAEHYLTALSINPEQRDAHRGLVDALTGKGDLRGALRASQWLVDRFREAPILDKHAYLLFSLGEIGAAEDFYRRALVAAPRDVDARLGLAWCAQRAGRRSEARARFVEVIASSPEVAQARQGLALLGPELVVSPRVFGQGWVYPNNTRRAALWSLTLGADLVFDQRYSVSFDYRHMGDAATPPVGAAAGFDYAQDEAHLRLGLDEKRWGAALIAGMTAFPGWVLDASSTSRAFAGVAGAQGRLTAWATLRATLLWSHFGDADLAELDLQALLPIARRVSLLAGGRLELASDGVRGAGRLEARIEGERWMIAAAAQAGSEWRPYDVDTRAIYNLNDLLRFGAELRAWVPLARWLDGYAAVGWEQWRPIVAGNSDYDSLRFTLGLSATLSTER